MKKKIFYLSSILLLFISLTIIIYPYLVSKKETDKIFNNLENDFSLDEIEYLIDNEVDLDNLDNYTKYKHFNVYDYFQYENIRATNNYSYLESINSYRYPNYYNPYINPKNAVFMDSPLVLVNKSFYLEPSFIPSNLVNVMDYEIEYMNSDIMLKQEALDNYELMYKDARDEAIEFALFSGFRSYKRQEYLFYNIYNDDTISAKPGHSEHQTGYALDISPRDVGLINELEYSSTYEWLVNNSHKYGFILRFPKYKTNITTYQFEPWHFRYVGPIASFIMESSLTLEEYIFSYQEI